MSKQRYSRRIFNICLVGIIIIIIIFIAMMITLNYDVKGETNMPFKISKISIVSTVDGEDVEDEDNKWHLDVIQNNDIYIYIEKNEDYRKQETIESVRLSNFYIEQPTIGEMKNYKPISDDTTLFKNTEENIIENLEFKGTKATDTRNLEISNQGGVICFRCANSNIGTYISDDDDEINYNQLINKLNINEDDLVAKETFNITITLDSGKTFEAQNIEVKIPNENIVEDGTVGTENINLDNIVFKRI